MLLEVNSIKVNYGHFQAIDDVSLNISEGEIVALLGSNGAGKTTTINSISGLVKLSEGSISFNGKDITNLPVYERVNQGLVQVPEGRKLFPFMSVMDNLMIGSYPKRAKEKKNENLEMCLELFPKLAERKNQQAGSLSGGEQQMCAIARALMETPKLLMLDEPSLGLAPVIVDQIFDTLIKIRNMGMTLLLVEQNVLSSLEIADRAYVIETGHNVMEGDSSSLMDNADLKKAYLGI